jgi:hypothetical protein
LDSVLAAFTSDCPLSLKDTLSTAIAFFQWVGTFSDWVTDAPLIAMVMELFTADDQPEGGVICAHLLKLFQLAVVRGAAPHPLFSDPAFLAQLALCRYDDSVAIAREPTILVNVLRLRVPDSSRRGSSGRSSCTAPSRPTSIRAPPRAASFRGSSRRPATKI